MSYFNSLDTITLERWFKCLDGELNYTRIDLNKGTDKEDFEAWCIIHDEYLKDFRQSDEIDSVTELRKRIAILECEYVIENDNYLRNEIRRLTVELFELLDRNRENGLSREGLIIQLEKWIGFRLDKKEISARKFYSIAKEFEREIKAKM